MAAQSDARGSDPFITRFKRPSAVDAAAEISGQTGIETSREAGIEITETSREASTEANPPDALAGLAAQKILLLLQSEPASTAKNLAQKIGITEKGIRYHLEQLKKQGKLRHVGSTKAGYWEVLEEASE